MEGNDVFEIPIRWFPKINLNFCSEFPRNYNNILSIEELHYLLSMIIRFNTAFESYVLRWIGGRLNSCSMITKNRAAFESCSAIVRELNSRDTRGGGGNSKAKELELCNRNNTVAHTQFQDFSCALPLPFHEKIARLVTRFPGTRLQRFRAYFIARFSIRTYLFHSDGVTRNRAGTRCRWHFRAKVV